MTDERNDNTSDKEVETNLTDDTTQNTNRAATGTTPALEVLNEIKAAMDAMLKKQDNQDKVNSAVTERLDILTTASRGRGQSLLRRPGGRLTPTVLFSTPDGAPRTRTFLPLHTTSEAGEGSQARQTTRPLEKDAQTTDGAPQVVNLVEDVTTEINPARRTDTERTEAHQVRTARDNEEIERDNISDEDLLRIQQLDDRRDEALRTQKVEIAEMRARMERATEEMKAVQSQMHKATSKAPQLDLVLEEAQNTPFTTTITRARMSDPGKIRLPTYEGKTDPSEHINAFAIAMGRASFREEEKDAG